MKYNKRKLKFVKLFLNSTSPTKLQSFHPNPLLNMLLCFQAFLTHVLFRREIRPKKIHPKKIDTPARWAPTSYKWSCKPYKWPYKWVTGVITPFITSRGPPKNRIDPPEANGVHLLEGGFPWSPRAVLFFWGAFQRRNTSFSFLFLGGKRVRDRTNRKTENRVFQKTR